MAGKTFDLSVIFRVLDKASGPIKKVTKNFKQLGDTAKKAGKKMKEVGRDMSMKMTLPIVAFGALAIRSAISFQKSMNMAGAVTKATGEQFIQLEKLAKNLGATTQFSASEAAEGMKFLGMAGLTVTEIMGALPRTLELAASAQMDLGTAADIVTNIMSGYRLETKDLAMVNDVLVNAFTSSNTNLQQLGEGMKVVGPVAKGLEFRFNETAAALGILAKNAFQGTLGGTGLRRIMTNLMSPSKKAQKMFDQLGIKVKNADGSLKDITGVLGEFEEAQKRGAKQVWLTQAAMEAFGQRGGPQFIALLGAGSKELKKFEKNLEETGTAAKVAAAQMKGLPGAFLLLKSAFEAVQLAIMGTTFGDFIEKIVRGLSAWLQKMAKLNPIWLKWAAILASVIALIGPLLIGIGLLATGMATLSAVSLPVALISAAILVLVAAIGAVIYYWDDMTKKMSTNPFGFLIDLVSMLTLGIIPNFEKWQFIMSSIWNTIKGIGSSAFNLIPDFLKKKMGMGGASAGVPGGSGVKGLAGAEGKSQTDINLNVSSDQGSTVTVEKVKKKSGDANFNLNTVGYAGMY